jgi:hypothetical protein
MILFRQNEKSEHFKVIPHGICCGFFLHKGREIRDDYISWV